MVPIGPSCSDLPSLPRRISALLPISQFGLCARRWRGFPVITLREIKRRGPMQKNKTLIILFLTSATALATANAQMSPAANASGTTGTVAPNSLVNNTTTNTDQILLLSNFPGTNFLILAAADSLLEI